MDEKQEAIQSFKFCIGCQQAKVIQSL